MGIELKMGIVRRGGKKGQRIMSGKQNTEERWKMGCVGGEREFCIMTLKQM